MCVCVSSAYVSGCVYVCTCVCVCPLTGRSLLQVRSGNGGGKGGLSCGKKAGQECHRLEEMTRAWVGGAVPDAGPEQSPHLPHRAQHDTHFTEEETEAMEVMSPRSQRGGPSPQPSPLPSGRHTEGSWGSQQSSEKEARGDLGVGGQRHREREAVEQGVEVAPGSARTQRGVY